MPTESEKQIRAAAEALTNRKMMVFPAGMPIKSEKQIRAAGEALVHYQSKKHI